MSRELFWIALGALVAHHRRDRSLSQAALADLLGVSQPTIARLEAGRWPVPVSATGTLARTLGFGGVATLIDRVEGIAAVIQRAADAVRPEALLRAPADGLAAFVVAALEKEVARAPAKAKAEKRARP